jgi:hypothetical protein
MRRILFVAVSVVAAGAQAQAPAGAPTWTVSPTPTINIGDETNTQTQFNGVSGVLRMPTGEIVVANSRSQELRVFSATGQYLRTLSRSGRGPGELRFLGSIWRGGDTIFASESQPGEANLHSFTPRAFLGKSPVRNGERGGIGLLGRFADGRFLVSSGFRALPELPVGTLVVDTVPLGVAAIRDTIHPTWIGRFTNSKILLIDSPFVPGRPFPVDYTFAGRLGYAVSGDRAWIVSPEDGMVNLYNSAGQRTGGFKLPVAPRPLNAEVIRRLRSTLPAEAPNRIERLRIEALYSAPLPKQAPLFSALLPGVNGEMWVRLYEEDPAKPASYAIVTPVGKVIGRVTVPIGLTPFEIGTDYVLGVQKDEDGLEHIVQHRLQRR